MLFVISHAYRDSVKTLFPVVSCGELWCVCVLHVNAVCTPKSECAHMHTLTHTPGSSSPFCVVIMIWAESQGSGQTVVITPQGLTDSVLHR